MYGRHFPNDPARTANPRVTAGFRCASLLPQATAVNTPAITANAQPAVITIHPAPSLFVRFSSTPATTPSPSNINIIVPRNSPRKGDVIRRFLSHASHESLVHPIKGPCHSLVPLPVQTLTAPLFHARLPFAVHRPIRPQLLQPRKKTNRQPRHISRAQRRSLLNHRTHHFAIQNIRLKLHQQLVHHRSEEHTSELQSLAYLVC